MKSISPILLFALLSLCCYKEQPAVPSENCQVLSTDNGRFIEHYDYGQDGMVKMIHYTQEDGMVINISLKRDQQGLLQEAEWHYAPPDTSLIVIQKETFFYDGKNLKTIETRLTDGTLLQTKHFKYDHQSRIVEIFTDEVDPASGDSKSIFGYDLEGIQTLYEVQSGKGDIYFRYVTKPSGNPGKASEIYLTDHGLPYGLTTNFAYGYKDPGEGTKQEAYTADQNGDLRLVYTLTLKWINNNTRGFTSEIIWADDASGAEYRTMYGFGECR